jgi:hypothetical protein
VNGTLRSGDDRVEPAIVLEIAHATPRTEHMGKRQSSTVGSGLEHAETSAAHQRQLATNMTLAKEHLTGLQPHERALRDHFTADRDRTFAKGTGPLKNFRSVHEALGSGPNLHAIKPIGSGQDVGLGCRAACGGDIADKIGPSGRVKIRFVLDAIGGIADCAPRDQNVP